MAPLWWCHCSHNSSDTETSTEVESAARRLRAMVESNEVKSNEFVGSSNNVAMDEVKCINGYEMRAVFVIYSVDAQMMDYKLMVALLFASHR